MALPVSMERWSDGVMTPWITGMTEVLPQVGQGGVRFGRFFIARLRVIAAIRQGVAYFK
jgi:hypothetical protein